MGDYNVIAAVTRTLVQVIQDGINRCEGDIARATVTTSRPDRGDPNPQPRVNLFMFHAVPNPYLRNDDLPLRTASGLLCRPMIALDLFYLLSFYGNDELNRIEPQVLMGATMSALNSQPILLPETIIRAAASFDTPLDSRFAVQQVQVTLQNMSVDELSRLWGTFPQVPYAPSVCYRVSAVMIEANETPAPAVPVSGVVASAAPIGGAPVISAVRGVGDAVPVYGQDIVVQGRGLAGQDVAVLLGGAVLQPSSVTPTVLTVRASGRGMAAGVQSLHVARDGLLSQPTPMALAPVVSDCAADARTGERGGFTGTVTVSMQPAVLPDQELVLDLFPLRSSLLDLRRSYRFFWGGADHSVAGTRLAIPIDRVTGGAYLVRVTVDGAASLLTTDARGRYNGPTVSIAASDGVA